MPEPQPNPDSTSLAERYRVLVEVGRKLARTLSPPELYRSI
jgi:hypothetical protein